MICPQTIPCSQFARILRIIQAPRWLAAALIILGSTTWTWAEEQKRADQTQLLEGTPDSVPIPVVLGSGSTLRVPTGLSQDQVITLLTQLLPTEPTTSTCPLNPATYYVLHLVRHERGEPATRNDAWYAFTCSWKDPGGRAQLNDPEITDHYQQARLFGAKQLSMLYLHYGVPVTGELTAARLTTLLTQEWTKQLPSAAEASVASKELELFWKAFQNANPGVAWPNNTTPTFTAGNYTQTRTQSVTELTRLANELSPTWVAEFRASGTRITSPRGKKLTSLNEARTVYVEEDFLPITYKIDIFRKAPAWQDDLRTITNQFNLQGGGLSSVSIPMTTGALFNKSLDISIHYPTSDIVITGIRGASTDITMPSKVIATKTYDNERKYWFDLGFVVPFKSIKELKFNKDDKLVQTKPVEKNRLYATVGFFPLGSVNTKADRLYRLAPTIIYGMSLDKTPWNHQLIGVGLGLKWAQPFIGLAGNRSAIAATDGTIDSYQWGWRLTYGLQIPTSAITGAIKK